MAKMGRPSKGDRTVLYSRVPTSVVERLKAEADARGLPYADVVAEILCDHYGEVYEFSRPANPNQERLELTA
ncbi:hypothetical protein SAMN05661080_05155 [Modestobacter sp. DSM 44400]|uniref:hypothetical protein n=1 Tax=Modestobacter sp. DSM 44400 TaxID=1550230 RepID=UPI00089B5367|nr:hypothetical protein [Modestobacter sp. DSM 44400]SDY96608.1 hypothetical protein SAMN05661080_05155 [Modestobacter sp. DSM 44400]